jgi:hypothetical protein
LETEKLDLFIFHFIFVGFFGSGRGLAWVAFFLLLVASVAWRGVGSS